MKTKQKNYKKWIAALVLTVSLTAAGSAFADEWMDMTASAVKQVTSGGTDSSGVGPIINQAIVFVSQSTVISGPEGSLNCADSGDLVFHIDLTTHAGKAMYAQALMADTLVKKIRVSAKGTAGQCQMTRFAILKD